MLCTDPLGAYWRFWKTLFVASFPFLIFLCFPGFSNAQTRARAFDLYPPTNDATPVLYQKSAPAFQENGKDWSFSPGAEVKISVDDTQAIRSVNPYLFGCNVACWDGKDWFLDPDRVEKAKQAGIKFWRWPGGVVADDYHWDNSYGSHHLNNKGEDITDMNGSWRVSTDDFIEFCRQTGSEAVVTVNYAAARYENVQYAADLAARWVKYFNIEKKFKVRYWEIGNECYGPWEEGNQMPGKPQLTGDVYGSDFLVMEAAMKKVDPDIYVGAVVFPKDGEDEWIGHHWWSKTLLTTVQNQADFLVFPEYFIWPFDTANHYTYPSDDELLSDVREIQDDRDALGRIMNRYALEERNIPIELTEFNILNIQSPPTIELISGLYNAEILGTLVEAGYGAANYWDWKNGLDPLYKGDHGMLADGDPSIPDATPRPAYYAYALYSRAFGDTSILSYSLDPKVKVYASRFSGGELGLVIVNENEDNRTLVFNFSDFQPKGRLMGWILNGSGMDDRNITWNGVSGLAGSGGPFPLDTISPYRMNFQADQPLQLNIPATSAVGIVVY
jgi:hypothetical protein